MVRQTSLEAYNTIKNNGLLSARRWQIYDSLFQHGPCTANELFKKTRGFNTTTQANFHARLGELRELGVVAEVQQRACETNGNNVIEWDVTSRLPLKLDKPKKHRCKTCQGKGYLVEQQIRLF